MKEGKNLVLDGEQQVSACMFDLGDGHFTNELDGKQRVRSIIVDVDEHRGIALGICPSLMMLPWCFSVLDIDTSEIVSGREATAILLEEAAKQKVELPAAEFCVNYAGFGVKRGTAFLPSRTELARVASHGRSLEPALTMIGFNKCDHTFWSSSVNCDAQVWMQGIAKHTISGWQPQMRTFGIMPMIEIVL